MKIYRLFTLILIIICVILIYDNTSAREQSWEELNRKALKLRKEGKYREAISYARRAFKVAERKYGREHLKTLKSMFNLAVLYQRRGRYSEAESLRKRGLKILEKVFGKDHPEVAISLNNLALLYKGQGRYSEAESLYKRSLTIFEKAMGKKHPGVALCLANLAYLYKDRGRYSKAEPLLKRSLMIFEEAFGKKHFVLAIPLDNIAEIYKFQGRYSDARSLYIRALKIREKVLGKEHPLVATSLNNLALLYDFRGRYSDAEPLYKRALKIREKVLGKEHLDVAQSLNNLAALYRAQGRYSKADPLFRRALAIVKKVHGKDHPLFALNLNNLAALYRAQGRYSEAEPLYRRALEIIEKVPGKEHPFVATSLSNMAGLYFSQGRYAKAELLYKRALAINEKILGKEHLDTAISLNCLALLYYTLGRYSDAEPLYIRALMINKKVFGKENPAVALGLNNLAALYYSQGRYSEAEPLHLNALAIREKVLGKEHPDVAESLDNLAALYYSQGRYSEAEPLYKKALAINEKVLGKEHPHIATSLNNLAALYYSQGRYSEAEPIYKRALAIRERVLGKEHPDVATNLNKLALLFVATGRREKAFPLMQRTLSIDEKVVDDVFKTSSEKQKFEFLATVQYKYEIFINLIVGELRENPDALTAGLDAVLRRKGIVLEAISRERDLILKSAKPEVRRTYKKLYDISSLLASLTLAGPGKMKMEKYRQRLNELRDEREKLEKKLTEMSAEYNSKKRTRLADCKKVAAKLPPGSVLVEYIDIRSFNFKARKWGESEYYAFVLPSSKDVPSGKTLCPRLISLGKSSHIDRAVNEFRKSISRTRILWQDRILDESEAEKRLAKKGKRLFDLVIAPIKKAVGKSKTLYIAPDGDLNLIPFDALQDETGHYLIEKYRINYLSCGRDLIGFEHKTANNGETLIIADPDYDMSGSDRVSASKGILSGKKLVAIRGGARSTDLSLKKWRRLPGTRKEAKGIKKILVKEKVKEYTDKSALEEIVKGAGSPRRIHIATHGFFLDDQDDLELLKAGTRGGGFNSRGGAFSRIPIKIENPLLRSGLVFAGANKLGEEKLPKGCEDGILTALEISGIPLHGTDLVVLSACETGVGKTRRGEGVFGLRRAFQLAGARTVVMSLWSVPDKQTQELMIDYYGRLKKGESKSDALRNARLAMMKSRGKKLGAAHPFFWASFISVGEP